MKRAAQLGKVVEANRVGRSTSAAGAASSRARPTSVADQAHGDATKTRPGRLRPLPQPGHRERRPARAARPAARRARLGDIRYNIVNIIHEPADALAVGHHDRLRRSAHRREGASERQRVGRRPRHRVAGRRRPPPLDQRRDHRPADRQRAVHARLGQRRASWARRSTRPNVAVDGGDPGAPQLDRHDRSRSSNGLTPRRKTLPAADRSEAHGRAEPRQGARARRSTRSSRRRASSSSARRGRRSSSTPDDAAGRRAAIPSQPFAGDDPTMLAAASPLRGHEPARSAAGSQQQLTITTIAAACACCRSSSRSPTRSSAWRARRQRALPAARHSERPELPGAQVPARPGAPPVDPRAVPHRRSSPTRWGTRWACATTSRAAATRSTTTPSTGSSARATARSTTAACPGRRSTRRRRTPTAPTASARAGSTRSPTRRSTASSGSGASTTVMDYPGDQTQDMNDIGLVRQGRDALRLRATSSTSTTTPSHLSYDRRRRHAARRRQAASTTSTALDGFGGICGQTSIGQQPLQHVHRQVRRPRHVHAAATGRRPERSAQRAVHRARPRLRRRARHEDGRRSSAPAITGDPAGPRRATSRVDQARAACATRTCSAPTSSRTSATCRSSASTPAPTRTSRSSSSSRRTRTGTSSTTSGATGRTFNTADVQCTALRRPLLRQDPGHDQEPRARRRALTSQATDPTTDPGQLMPLALGATDGLAMFARVADAAGAGLVHVIQQPAQTGHAADVRAVGRR